MWLTAGPRFLARLAWDAAGAARDEITGRRVWARAGRAHLEVRGLHDPDCPDEFVGDLERTVTKLPGVNWAAANGVLGDLVVDYDYRRVGTNALRRTVSEIERIHGLNHRRRDRPAHPHDFEPVAGGLVGIGGDLLGAAVAVGSRAVGGLALPAEAMALPAIVDFVPEARRRLEHLFGADAVELGLSLVTSVLGAAAQTPLSSLADAALRSVELPAALARHQTWHTRARELTGSRQQARARALPRLKSRSLPPGPIEQYAKQARLGTAVTAAGLLPFGGLRKAARACLIGAPKAAQMGAAAYAAELGRVAAERGVIVRVSDALHCLDRVDTVIIDARVLTGGNGELAPLAEETIAAGRALGRVLISPKSPGLAGRIAGFSEASDGDGFAAGGPRLLSFVQKMQNEGHVVALITDRDVTALAAADCGIGLLRTRSNPPWSADLLCGPGLEAAWFLLQASLVAKAASTRSVRLAMLGSIAGGLLGLIGPEAGAARRGTFPVNAAAFASVAASVWSANRLAGKPAPIATDNSGWHEMSVETILRELRTALTGLTSGQAAARREQTADADDDKEAAEGLIPATISELDNPLTAPLATGAGMSAASGSVVDAALVVVVMAGNAILGAVQRMSASKAVRRLASAGALRARVFRDGHEQLALATDLVPGDVITLRAGDTVAADCRLLVATNLEMDESSLTGESMPVAKSAAPSDASAIAERSSMVYAGTTVAAGSGSAVVVAVGRSTEAGRSAFAGETFPGAPVGVEARLRKLTAVSVPIAIGASGILLLLGLLRGRLGQSIGSAVALAVAAVPEGLPFIATVAQLAAARRLSHHNVLVRTPRTLEALGRVDVVCFDKTGTLTKGSVDLRTVSDCLTDEPVERLTDHRREVLAAGIRACPAGEDLPHPTDRAVLAGGAAAGLSLDSWTHLQELPFEPGRGFHAVLGIDDGQHAINVKGAPEVVLPKCEDIDRPQIEEAVERLARQGYRVLAVASRRATDRAGLDSERVDRLQFLGLLGLADPVRPTAAEAVRKLRAAGVDIVMLTGDHPSTASAIAAELGLLNGSVAVGSQLGSLDDKGLAELVSRVSVFARVSPSDKVAIVKALQAAGRVVAVTGDGANDAPAIRLAHVGIALGEHSTPAARQSADIVVTDDRIETIVDAVIESRAMWRGVRNSIALLLGGNLGEIAFTLVSSLLSPNSPINARQLLLVNLLTDLLPAMALAARPPRNLTPEELLAEGPDAAVGDALVRDIVVRAAATGISTTAGWIIARFTGTPGRAGTVALASLIGAQLAQTAMSADGDPVVLAAIAGSVVALVGIVQFPPTSLFFGCRPIGPMAWVTVAGVSALSVVIGRLGST